LVYFINLTDIYIIKQYRA